MKITPIAGSGIGAVTTGTGSVSPDRREAAQRAFLGQTQTTITPSEAPEDREIQTAERNIRKIKMRTNASPDRFLNEAMQASSAEATEETSKSASSDESIPAEEVEVTRPISPQFAELARRQRALQVKEREIAAKEKALADKASGSQGIEIEKIKANPLSVLQQAGVTYEELTQAILAEQSGVSPELQALRAKVDELEKGVDQKFQSREVAAEEAALTEMLFEAESLAKEGEDYEMIRENKAYDKVLRQIYAHYKKTGQVLDVKSVMDQVEKKFVDDALRFASFKKVQSKLTPAEQEQAAVQTNKLRTLTNRQTASVPMSAKARAIAAFNGTLKK